MAQHAGSYVAGCPFRAVELCAHAVHAHADLWLVNERGAVASAGRLAAAPDDATRFGLRQPADLEEVRASYDRVADTYVDLAVGRLDDEPWLEHARRRYPSQRFDLASATDLDLAPASLGGVLGWWSLCNLPRGVLPEVVADFARALVPGGQLLIGTHVGDQDIQRRQAYGGVPVTWTTHRWLPEQLVDVFVAVGLETVAELRFPASGDQSPQVVLAARRPRP